MSTLRINNIESLDGRPVNFRNGFSVGAGASAGGYYDIGVMGQIGAGVGICPDLPAGYAKLAGTESNGSDTWGNYIYSDGSIQCFLPIFWLKYGTGSNGLAVNVPDIKPFSFFPDAATANAAGYFIPRAFYNAGSMRMGFFVDKYLCSNNGGIASSIRYGNPLSSSSDHNPFSALNGNPSNTLGGALAAAKTRGANFFCGTIFIKKLLAMISLAHASAATSTAACSWYDSTGVKSYPKGCNNDALGDANDSALSFVSDGYSNCAKTGSANFLARTTHNGQACGVADVNGLMWDIAPGITSNGTNFYILKTSADAKALTGGNTLATDAWGATGIAALYDSLGATYESLTASGSIKLIGHSSQQVFSSAVSGNAWAAAAAGIPLVSGVGGSNKFGNDVIWDYRINEACSLVGGSWYWDGSGVWGLRTNFARSDSIAYVGFRAALYL
jgi:hypothetical protein